MKYVLPIAIVLCAPLLVVSMRAAYADRVVNLGTTADIDACLSNATSYAVATSTSLVWAGWSEETHICTAKFE